MSRKRTAPCACRARWTGGWRVTIGGAQHAHFEAEAYVDNPTQAAQWLHEQAIKRYPEYKLRYGNRVIVARPGRHLPPADP
jgi:hypothetical protein